MGQPQATCPACSTAINGDARFCGSCGHALSAPGTPAQSADLSGREIAGRYRLIECMGQGGMGAVYRAEQLSLKREVAVKLLKPELSSDPALVHRFNKEAELAARLNHPNTVTLFDFGQDRDGALFIAMELVQGRSLRELIMREGAIPASRALAICSQVSASLADAHASGIVHRDLKPDNVMLTVRGKETDVVRVLDFGIAKLRDERGDVTAMPVTQAGDLLGTPQYMAPEQIRGETVDGRTDVYAMGVMLYEMVSGQLPFEGRTVMAILGKHLSEMPVPPSTRRPDLGVPPAIDQLVMSAMQKVPGARPSSMEVFGEQIERLRAHLAPTAGAQVPRRTTRPPGVPLSVNEPSPLGPAPAQARRPTPPPYAAPMPAYASPPPNQTPHAGPYAAGPAPSAVARPHGRGNRAPGAHASGGGLGLALWLPVGVFAVAAIAVTAVMILRSSDDQPRTAAGAGAGDMVVVDEEWYEGTEPEPWRSDPGTGGRPAGDAWEHPVMGYQLVAPPGYLEQPTATPDLVMWNGEHDGYRAFIGLSGQQLGGILTEELLRSSALDMLQASGATLVATDRREVQGAERWTITYDLPAAGTRWEVVLFGHRGAMIALAFGTARAAFDSSAPLRRELFSRRLRLP